MAATFQQCLSFSRNRQNTYLAHRAMRAAFQDLLNVQPSTPVEDRLGVDYWVTLKNGRRIGVDVKVSRNYIGWLPLETWSSVEDRKIGWTLREDYITDYVIWIWPRAKRFALVPFRKLREAFKTFGRDWYLHHPVSRQFTPRDHRRGRPSYHSEMMLVPVHTVFEAMRMVQTV